jgi:myo-inositol 2-dehydrogenase/D-chiro-inositol 1-dehydrogenase
MRKINIAIIGLGDMGTGHIRGFDDLENARIQAVCDSNPLAAEKAIQLLKNNKPVYYSTYKDVLQDKSIEAVVIALPGYLHEEVFMECIKANKHVLLEKPVAINYESFKRMKYVADNSDLIIQIGLVYRYSRFYRTIAQKLRGEKELENVMLAWCKEYRQCFPQEDWFYDKNKSGGTIVEKNCHHFDIFNWVIGSRPKKVFAIGGQHVYKDKAGCVIDCNYSLSEPKVINDISIVDHAIVAIEYENGAKANLNLCMYLRPMNVSGDGLEIGFIGTNGKQLIARRDEEFGIYGGERSDGRIFIQSPADDGGEYGHIGCQRQRIEFLECIENNTKPFAGINETYDAMLTAFAAEKSIEEGRIVDLSEFC